MKAKKEIHIIITLFGYHPLGDWAGQLFADRQVFSEPGTRVLKAAPGVMLQLCGCGAQAPTYLASTKQPIIAFKVADLEQAIKLAEAQGARMIERTTDPCTGFSFCYLQLADGSITGCFASV